MHDIQSPRRRRNQPEIDQLVRELRDSGLNHTSRTRHFEKFPPTTSASDLDHPDLAPLKVEDHPASRSSIDPQPAGRCSTFDFRVHHLQRCLVNLQVTAGHEITANQVVKRLKSRGRRRHPIGQCCSRNFHAKKRYFLLHPIQRTGLQILRQIHVRQKARTTISLSITCGGIGT